MSWLQIVAIGCVVLALIYVGGAFWLVRTAKPDGSDDNPTGIGGSM